MESVRLTTLLGVRFLLLWYGTYGRTDYRSDWVFGPHSFFGFLAPFFCRRILRRARTATFQKTQNSNRVKYPPRTINPAELIW